jgi:hypothetical protein
MTNSFQNDLEMAGLKLDRPMKMGAVWSAPVAEVKEDFLIYDAGARAKHNAFRGLLRGLLEARESREKTIKFCRRWGVLGLCEHGLPKAHRKECIGLAAFRRSTDPNGIPHAYYRESVESVRCFAGALESLLSIGAAMAQGKSGHASDWDNACEVITGPDFPPWPENPSTQDLRSARLYLQTLMRRLIEICRIRPRFWWNDETGSWQIDLDSEGSGINLPTLIVHELMVAIADKDGFASCSSCHKTYIPGRRPDPTRRNYCPSCGRSAALRDASRAYREAQRTKKRKVVKHAKA